MAMNERERNILPAIGLFIIIGLLLSAFVISRYNTENKKGSNYSAAAKPTGSNSLDQTGEASTQGSGKITINAVSSEVNISNHNSDMVEAHYYGEVKASGNNALPRLEVGNDGNEVFVKIKYPTGSITPITEQTRLDVLIPEKWAGDLEIVSISGSITAPSLTGSNVSLNNVSGPVEVGNVEGDDVNLSSTSGRLKIGEIKARDKFQKSTVSGKCEIDTLICKEADLGSTSGETVIKTITADNVTSSSVSGRFEASVDNGDVEIETTSGDINIQFLDGFESFKASSISGKVALQIPENSEFEVDIRTISGDIECQDFPMSIISSKRNELKGKVGDGKSSIEISTKSGKIAIEKND